MCRVFEYKPTLCAKGDVLFYLQNTRKTIGLKDN